MLRPFAWGLTLRNDLSCITSILFVNVNFTHVRDGKITRHWKSTLIAAELTGYHNVSLSTRCDSRDSAKKTELSILRPPSAIRTPETDYHNVQEYLMHFTCHFRKDSLKFIGPVKRLATIF